MGLGTLNSGQLANLFGVSPRQIELLVAVGVLDHCGTAKNFRFDLETAVSQYITFLQSGSSLRDWTSN